MKPIIKLSPIELETTLDNKVFVLVMFSRGWESSSIALEMSFYKTEAENTRPLEFVQVSTIDYPEFTHKYIINTTPTLILYKEGVEIKRATGYKTATDLNDFLDLHVASNTEKEFQIDKFSIDIKEEKNIIRDYKELKRNSLVDNYKDEKIAANLPTKPVIKETILTDEEVSNAKNKTEIKRAKEIEVEKSKAQVQEDKEIAKANKIEMKQKSKAKKLEVKNLTKEEKQQENKQDNLEVIKKFVKSKAKKLIADKTVEKKADVKKPAEKKVETKKPTKKESTKKESTKKEPTKKESTKKESTKKTTNTKKSTKKEPLKTNPKKKEDSKTKK